MIVAVSANGEDLDAQFAPAFGRCPVFWFIDSDTLDGQAVPNQGAGAPGGAGIQAAQFVVQRGAKAVITGRVGPNAHQVLAAADIPIYTFGGDTVRQAVAAYARGELTATSSPTGPAHAGMPQTGGGNWRGGRGRAGHRGGAR